MNISLGDAPAWVQAIGSIIAILVTGRLVELTARRARLDRLFGVDGIFLFCANCVQEAAEVVHHGLQDPQPLLDFPTHRLTDGERMLAQVSEMLLEIGSEKLPQMTSDATQIIRSSIKALSDARAAITTTRNIAADGILLSDNAKQLRALRARVVTFVSGQQRRVRFWWNPWS